MKVVEQFDEDGDGKLDRDERDKARPWVKEQRQAQRRGGRGRFGGRGRGGNRDEEPRDPPVGQTVEASSVESFQDHELFDPEVVRTYFLTFPLEDWHQEMSDFYRTDVDIPALLVVDGVEYPDVGVHFRGNTSFQARGKKKSIHLDINFTHGKQRLYGHRATNLINNNSDPSQLREPLGAWIANRHSKALRANFVRVVINGEDYGLYSQLEHLSKDFTDEQFGSSRGARFKVPPDFSGNGALKNLGDKPEDYQRNYELKSDPDPKAWERLVELCQLLDEASDEELVARLPDYLDIDGALWFLAIDNALIDGDGYYGRGSDYSLWLDSKGRFHVLARDGNEVLGTPRGRGGRPGQQPRNAGGRRGSPPRGDDGGRPRRGDDQGAPPRGNDRGRGGRRSRGGMRSPTIEQGALTKIDDENRPLVHRMLQVPAWRERYLAFLHTLLTETMNWEVIGPRVVAWRASIDDLVQQDVHSIYGVEAYERALAEDGQEDAARTLRGVVTTRHTNLMADPALQGEWPQIAGGSAEFTANPVRGEVVLQVTARAGEGPTIEKMLLHHATGDLGGFSAVPMFDDGEHGDGQAGDGTYGATVAEVEPGRKIRFWVEAITESGRVACQPSSGGARPNVVRAPGKKKKKKQKK